MKVRMAPFPLVEKSISQNILNGKIQYDWWAEDLFCLNSNSPISNIPEIPPFILYINNPLLSEKGVVGNSWVRNLRGKFLLSFLDWKNQEDGKFEDFWLKNLGENWKKKMLFENSWVGKIRKGEKFWELKVVFEIFKRKARRRTIGGRRHEILVATFLLIDRRPVCCSLKGNILSLWVLEYFCFISIFYSRE